jgi:Ca2+-dependent lipid-binding protein
VSTVSLSSTECALSHVLIDQGTLRVELLDGHDIAAADRGGKANCMPTLNRTERSTGKSDPFAVFTLNGQKVFKSQTKKKTLTPDWQESFAVQVVCHFSNLTFDTKTS